MRASSASSPDERIRVLESARSLALDGNYRGALDTVERCLKKAPDDIEAKRLKGNVLELYALNKAQYEPKKLLRYPAFREARQLYEEILADDASNTLALTDLGDHFRNLEAFDQALGYYERCIAVLRRGESRVSWSDELTEAYEGMIEIALARGDGSLAENLRNERDELLKARK